MAKRRMFSNDIISTDRFMDLSYAAQTLYLHFGMNADDDGFLASPGRIMRTVGVDKKAYQQLIDTGFILTFDSGVIVITDWKINNWIQSDRYTATIHEKERASVELDNVKRYMYTNCIQSVSVGKDSIGKVSIGNNSMRENRAESENIFNQLWAAYPEKKGKAKVSDKDKRRLAKIGLEQGLRAIDRYKKEVEGSSYLHYQHGSTFFRKGIDDYLDDTYTPTVEKKTEAIQRKKRAEAAGGCCLPSTGLTEQQQREAAERNELILKQQAEMAAETRIEEPIYEGGLSAEVRRRQRKAAKNERQNKV